MRDRANARARLPLVVALALVVLAGAAAAAIALRGGGPEAASYRGSAPPAGITLPSFELPDHTGKPISSTTLRGTVVLVTFLDTQCTEACPVIASQIGQALELLAPEERRQVVPLAISTDPDEDTAESILAFLRRHRVEGELHYLVAPVRELRPVWNAFQIASSFDTGEDTLHSAPVRIFDPQGVWVSTLHAGADLTPENLAHDVRVAMRGD